MTPGAAKWSLPCSPEAVRWRSAHSFQLVGVAVLATVLLIHPVAVLLIVARVVSVNVLLFGEMWLLSIVMAVGLAVDHSLHVMHTFLPCALSPLPSLSPCSRHC